VSFNNLVQTAPSTNIISSGGTPKIQSTGYYQITFGVMAAKASITIPYSFYLSMNSGGALPQNTIEFIQPTTEQNMYSMTTIVPISVNPTTVALVNGAAAAAGLNNATVSSTGAPAAYMTITKLL
jgi:hypothetical protein